jgi:hypothetical protein
MPETLPKIHSYLDIVVPLILKAVQEVIDAVVDGKDMTKDQIDAVRSGYCELTIWGKKFAAQTTTTYDDDAVATVLSICDKLLTEAEVPIPEL